jgi:deoxyribodipyrimidine photo-lyase
MNPQMKLLTTPPSDDDELESWLSAHLGELMTPAPTGSPLRGGQQAADSALQAFDVTGYARRRNNVWPERSRGASRLSPYIRHGLLRLGEVWDHVADGPPDDKGKFRDELLWQEYARHLYARNGTASGRSLRFAVEERSAGSAPGADPWSATEALCLESTWQELVSDGWLTNQTRMWLASHWSVRGDWGWRDGEDLMFRHLLDGSRAANRLGWQWTVGALTGNAYGFSRWQVEKRAPGLCGKCPLAQCCPVADWPPTQERQPLAISAERLRRDDDLAATAGPTATRRTGEPEAVWITAESLSDRDPAVTAHPELPVVFVFDEPLLARLRLSVNRFRFLAQTLADLATRRELEVWRGDPVAVLAGRRLATTFAPVPGWHSRAAQLEVAALHPWPWLMRPGAGPVSSYTAWRRGLSRRGG